MVVATNIKLQQRNFASANQYNIEGLWHFRPYDMLLFGSAGAAVAAAQGRYGWIVSGDHSSVISFQNDGGGVMVGFSSDPGIPPTSVTPVLGRLGDPNSVF